ncbi:uncharacterized protein LOC125765165 [Anopheles funestus]|uniref:uncharacterized protein LOC125765165 n=1 Tax=Anopheles funestus TaxID=62324 RepID=UPI0020C65428|nr:uncharacterized protein LOC125765165 [Anopheles funestus]
MKLSFDTRFCTLPATHWTLPLTCLPLSSSSALSGICARWLPADPPDVRIFLHSCCTLLLINNILSYVFLLSRNAVQATSHTEPRTRVRYLHYLLIVWQTNSLLVQGYICYQISNYQHVAELVDLLPLCLCLLFLDTCYAIALNSSLRVMSNIFYGTVFVAFHTVAWLMLLLSLTCIVYREYIDCSFI